MKDFYGTVTNNTYCFAIIRLLIFSMVLQMPEEQTFSVLVKIMFDYGLRDLFKDNFEVLHLRLYQLDRLMEVSYCCNFK